MTRSGWMAGTSTIVVTLALATPAFSQGKSQQSHGNNGRGSSPSQGTLPASTGPAGPAGAAPFAWIDDANLMTPGSVWVGMSMVRWEGAGLSEVSVPVVDAALGLAPRLQLGASVPRVTGSSDPAGPDGGLGTMYFSAKIGVIRNNRRGVKLAVAPAVEILSQTAMTSAPDDQGRVQVGLPVSVELDRGVGRIYSSTGYFSPGVWYAGAGAGMQVRPRVGMSVSFSRAWTTSSSVDPTLASPSRNEVSGGAFFKVTGNVGVFGSIGRTIGTSDENGAGTTIGVGLSLTARPVVFTKTRRSIKVTKLFG